MFFAADNMFCPVKVLSLKEDSGSQKVKCVYAVKLWEFEKKKERKGAKLRKIYRNWGKKYVI